MNVETPSIPTMITLNGEPRPLAADQTVGDLLAELKLQPKYLAVELNEQVLPRANFGATRLQAGDRVEIVTLVGGG
jgi:sulfur carrier protein